MQKKVELQISRYNIYSCLSVQTDGKQICFDPAKIRMEDMSEINPDLIVISHESMDHMNPVQVYQLQKKKGCSIICSIAAAVDLVQYYPQDIDFFESIIPLVPGVSFVHTGIRISSELSIHCDYMQPLVYKLHFLETNLSLLHCFDSHLSDEIVDLSEGTDLAIIPIGIAKGVSINTGIHFSSRLKSRYFATNHFKDETELAKFNELIQNDERCDQFFLVNWDEKCMCTIPRADVREQEETEGFSIEKLYESIHAGRALSREHLMAFLVNLNEKRTLLLTNEQLLEKLFDSYDGLDDEGKKILLMIATVISLIDAHLVKKSFLEAIQKELEAPSIDQVNSVKVMVLFFLGVYAQQSAQIIAFDHALTLIDDELDHVNYWVVEYLGRCAVSRANAYQGAIEGIYRVLEIPRLYTSVVVRRKLFWEFYRIMKYIPYVSNIFFPTFENGLVDSNPDVRLLATICLALANRVYNLSKEYIDTIFSLFNDVEDDVRECAVRVIGVLKKNHKEIVLKHIDLVGKLLEDSNCHVRFVAKETYRAIL